MKRFLTLFFLVFTCGWSLPALAVTSTVPLATTSTIATSTLPIGGHEGSGTDGGSVQTPEAAAQDGIYERALVEEATLRAQKTATGGMQVESYRVRFLSGPMKGQTKEIANEVGSNPYGIEPRKGDKVVIFIQPDADGNNQFYIQGFDRRSALIALVLLFVLVMVVLSGLQGLKTALAIFLSILMIGYVLIPTFLRGVNPVPVAILLSGAFTLISGGLSIGWNRKTYVTAIGTMGGALVAFFISWIFSNWAHLDGLGTEDDRLFFNKNPSLNPRGLLFAGIIIAAAGVVEDVAVSIASGVAEVKRANHRSSLRQLFQAGMVIGNDHMAALANTLVYAYVGSSLSTLLLYQQFGGSWLKFVNFDGIVDEVIRSLSGTIGLVFTVPITALLAAWVMQRHHQDHSMHQHVQSHVPQDEDL